MSDTSLREISADLRTHTKPIPPLEPTAVTMPASLASLAGDVERACKLLENIDVVAAAGTREQLVNSADALRHIAELSAGALGSLARSGIKPSPLSPVAQESRS